jgi:hypothetical protein
VTEQDPIQIIETAVQAVGKDIADQINLGIIPLNGDALLATIVDELCMQLWGAKPYVRPSIDHFSTIVGRTLEVAEQNREKSPLDVGPLLKEEGE